MASITSSVGKRETELREGAVKEKERDGERKTQEETGKE